MTRAAPRSLGAVFGGLLMTRDAFNEVSNTELGSLIQDVIREVVAD
jgi:hypothetical protein